ANVAVTAAIHAIDQNMYQIWVSALDRRQKKYLPGAETEAYVLIEHPEQRLTTDTHQNPSTGSAPMERPVGHPRPLISMFNLITASDPKVCATVTPWRAGIRRLQNDERLLTGSCLAIEIRLAFPARVFLIGQDAAGELTRLFPSRCPDLQTLAPVLASGRRFQFPPLFGSGKRVLELEGTPGVERIYAIAVTSPELADRFGYEFDQLQGLCTPGRRFPEKIAFRGRLPSDERVDRWHQYLIHFANQYPEELEWREFRFRHERSL
ncbi:MAG: DUF4384 domain-containing protein, partial [Desulfobacterales bacterium]